jgi:hypothetical protein
MSNELFAAAVLVFDNLFGKEHSRLNVFLGLMPFEKIYFTNSGVYSI